MADGATGTNLFMRGLETGYLPELWNVERPDDIIGLHTSFFVASSDLLLTNSVGGNALRLMLHEAQDRVAELNAAAVRFARIAADAAADTQGRRPIVAGSMGPTGELFEPIGTLTDETTLDVFAAQANALAYGGVDMLWIETISSAEEVAAAVEAAKATGLPVAVTLTFDTAESSMMGVLPKDFAVFGNANKANFLGANCGIGPAELLHSIGGMRQAKIDTPLIAKGNCGVPSYVGGAIHYHGTPALTADYALFAHDMGVTSIGGCCGTSPDHVAAMAQALAKTPVRQFDAAAIQQALGKPWADIPENLGDAGRRKSRRSRRK